MKLLARTTVFFLLYTAVVMVAGTAVYYASIHRLYYAYVDRTLARRKLRVKLALLHELRTPAELAFWHRIDHNVEFVSLPATTPRTISHPDEFGDRLMLNTLTGQQQRYRQVAEAVWFQGQPYQVQVRTSVLSNADLLAVIAVASGVLLAVLLGGILVIQHILTRRYWRPFYHTLGVLQQHQLDQHHAPVLPSTNIPEFKALNAALARVLGRHQRLYRRQREFAENAAHELQTPLAILRTKLDLLVQAPGLTEEQAAHIEPLLAVTQRLTHLCRSLLLLVHLDQQLYFPTETIDLTALLNAQLAQLQEQFAATSLTLHTELVPRVLLTGNRSLLESLTSNLVVNAIRHNVPGGSVEVSLTLHSLTITNSGRHQPLPADQLFARFRPGRAPGSVGLGLPIARQICEASGLLLNYHYEAPGRHQLQVRLG